MLLGQPHAHCLAYLEAHAKELFSWGSERSLELLDAVKELRMNKSWVLSSRLLLRQMLQILDEFESRHHTINRKCGTVMRNLVTLDRVQRSRIEAAAANIKRRIRNTMEQSLNRIPILRARTGSPPLVLNQLWEL